MNINPEIIKLVQEQPNDQTLGEKLRELLSNPPVAAAAANNLDYQYQQLLGDILDNGSVKKDRTGTGTISVFGREIRHDLQQGFGLLTTKRMFLRGVGVELEWFLQGRTDVKYLIDRNVNIWNGDAHKNYLRMDALEREAYIKAYPGRLLSWETADMDTYVQLIKDKMAFPLKYGQLGPVYGHQWRNQGGEFWDKDGNIHNAGKKGFDQLAEAVRLLRKDPDNRRIKVDAWNAQELQYMALPPCHTDFQLYTRVLTLEERIRIYGERHPEFVMTPEHTFLDNHTIPTRGVSLKWQQRSVDTFLGLPFNIASYSLLLLIIANEVNMMPMEVIGSLGDTHIYLNHVDQCRLQMERTPYKLPGLLLSPDATIDNFSYEKMVMLTNYSAHPPIKGDISN